MVQNQNTLVKIQPSMKAHLLNAVQNLQSRLQSFGVDYTTRYIKASLCWNGSGQ